MRMRRHRKRKPPGLMLTSLLDMFTIILIFLIVSFEAESFEFRLNSDLTLPESASRAQLRPAVNVAITGDQVLVSDEPVAELEGGYFPESAIQDNTLPSVVEALQAEFERRFGENDAATLAAAAEDADNAADQLTEPIIVVQADRELEYRTLYLILRSAATAGFFKYRLAILRA